VRGKVAEARAKLDVIRASLPTPEHPIEIPEFGNRVDGIKLRLGELQGRGQAALDAIRGKLEDLYDRTCAGHQMIDVPNLLEIRCCAYPRVTSTLWCGSTR
jgi:hypothetical protein